MLDCMNILPRYLKFENTPVGKQRYPSILHIKKNIAQKSIVVAESVATRIAPFRSDIARRKKSGQALMLFRIEFYPTPPNSRYLCITIHFFPILNKKDEQLQFA